MMPMKLFFMFFFVSLGARTRNRETLGTRLDPLAGRRTGLRRDKLLTVMNVNTYLLEVRFGGFSSIGGGVAFGRKPDMDERAALLAEWFNTLEDKDVPDVVVFNELFSKAGSRLLKTICNSKYRRSGWEKENTLACEPSKKFGSVTKTLGGVGQGISINGGVAIIVKAGLQMSDYRDGVFKNATGSDTLSMKGYISIKVSKPPRENDGGGSRPLEAYVVGTHTQAWPENHEIRAEQFHQIRAHIETELPPAIPVVVVGDFNVEQDEVDNMKKLLRASNPPLETHGFWMPLRDEIPFSAYSSGGFNAYLHFDPKEAGRMQPYDQIVYSTSDSVQRYGRTVPNRMRWQYVPMKSERCFQTTMKGVSKKETISVDDLSDHYAAYAELCYDETEQQCGETQIKNHYGVSGIGRDGPEKQCCPGRGLIEGKCFDWYPGGIKGDRISLSQQGDCMMTRNWFGNSRCKIKNLVHAMDVQDCYHQLARLDLPFRQLECEKR